MVEHVLLFDGAEGAQPDVEQHLGDLHSHGADALQKFGREMQPRRGRSRRAVLAAVHRLIALGVGELFVDIGRERHRSHAGEDVLKRAVIHKFYDTFARIRDRYDVQREFLVDDEAGARAALFPGTDEHLPIGEGEAL